jgi:DNA adenine methylase
VRAARRPRSPNVKALRLAKVMDAPVRAREVAAQPPWRQQLAFAIDSGGEVAVPKARPFVKWVGGKRQLLPAILERLSPVRWTFHEPFVGGGAVFFGLQPSAAVLSDCNARLIRTYAALKHSVEDVVTLLGSYPHELAFFQELRGKNVDVLSDIEVAAWFIYLNRTCFNGLYRVNRRNQFNVPFGRNPGATICDAENLRACSRALRHATLRAEDFASVLDRAVAGDVVYFDPPYVPRSDTSDFTGYTAGGFTMEDQIRLRDVAVKLRDRGVRVLLSNSATSAVRTLYEGPFGFECTSISASRAINSAAERRGAIEEFLIQ